MEPSNKVIIKYDWFFTVCGAILMMFAPFCTTGQINFQPGYFVTNEGEKVNCLIRNEKWADNPSRVEFKMTDTGISEFGTVQIWREFGISNNFKFVRATVALDKSSSVLSELDIQRMPQFVTTTVFLRQLVEGRARLFQYENGTLERFFFSVEKDTLMPLVFKLYRSSESSTGRNEMYKGQLTAALLCSTESEVSVRSLNYSARDLIQFVNHFNACNGDATPESPERIARINFYLRAGAGSQNMQVHASSIFFDDTIGPAIGSQIGMECEILIPSRGDRWGLVVGVSYQQFQGQQERQYYVLSTKYHSVDISLGPRYFFHLNSRSRVFANGGAAYSIPFNSELTYRITATAPSQITFDMNELIYFWFGAGYQRSRWSVEARYNTPRDPLNKYLTWFSQISGWPYLMVSFKL